MVTVGQLELLPQTLLARAEAGSQLCCGPRGGAQGSSGTRRRGRWATSKAHAAQPHQSEQRQLVEKARGDHGTPSTRADMRVWYPVFRWWECAAG